VANDKVSIVVFAGFGGRSSGVLRNAKLLYEELRSEGFTVEYSEVRVPATDREFEPFILVNGLEIYIPAVEVDVNYLVDYIMWRLGFNSCGIAGFPLPPSAAVVG
jgi:hypothetical protein